MGWWQQLLDWLGFAEDQSNTTVQPAADVPARQVRPQARERPSPVHKKISLIIHNPAVPHTGKTLNDFLGWHDPDRLAAEFIADIREVSYGYANYEIAERILVDDFPLKKDGFRYTADQYVRSWQRRGGFHQPDAVDYHALLDEFDMIAKVDSGAIDEFWLFAFPYAGYYESIMAGPGAFWCNAPPLAGTGDASRRFIIMGFNFERGVGEMLEAYGHRAESIMERVFRDRRGDQNLLHRFIRTDKSHPGRAEVGNIHFAPNSARDYDWGNPTPVPTRAPNWLNFPDLEGVAQPLTMSDWGRGDIRGHHKWWFKHLPHVQGEAGGIAYNWWQYIVDPNLV
jgi:hypothetical protein